MGRVLKGGVWTNLEDEVLKAAIMKYGTNQWARVASLLHKKSDKQCKTRWYEWLSPTVKKTEWTLEENEKLLHLGKILPTQWRTISDMIGRTAAQCVQQYTFLIEKNRVNKEGLGDVEALKQDDTDLRPESRPAKPDPIDMAEDEIDMLNEARARLANTQGKKAKRKGRERQLIMARRLAAVQQKRELAEVGIIGRTISNNKKKATINYNEEIPFYQPIPKGFHDTTAEKFEAPNSVIGKRVCDLEFETREEREKRERKKDIELKRKRMDENLPEAIKMNEKAPQIKRSKLILSEPKISNDELQTLLKIGHENDANFRAAVADGLEETSHLLGEYMSERDKAASITAERTPLDATNRLAMQVENIRAIHYTKTPLLGGANASLHNILCKDIPLPATTPNTSLRSNLLGTPMNNEVSGYGTPSLALDKDGARYNLSHKKKVTKESLDHLPTPNKDIKFINKKTLENEENETVNFNGTTGKIMDQAEIDRIKEEERRKIEAENWEKRSQVIKKGLPRPIEINHTILRPVQQLEELSLTDLQRADEMIKLEMIKMMHYDKLMNPNEITLNGKYITTSNSERKKLSESVLNQAKEFLKEHPYEEFTADELKSADQLLKTEMELVKNEMGHGDINLDTYSKVWEECLAQVLYLPSERRFTRANLVSRKDRVESYKNQLETYSSHYAELTKKTKKKEDKLNVLLGGYMARSKLLIKAVNDVYDQIERNDIELCSLTKMREQEQVAIVQRVLSMEADVERQKVRESALQATYADLIKKKEYLQGLCH